MRFLIDNALSPYLAKELSRAGYDAVHVRDFGMAAATDQAIFDLAAREDRVILSADADFGMLLASRNVSRPSVVIFRQSDKRPKTTLGLFLACLPRIEEALQEGAVVVFQDRRIRIRRLPLLPKV
ncbi:MAG: DUF5615 family PIN-like protein [Bacillota bacterium]